MYWPQTFESLFMSTLCIKWEKAKKCCKILKLNWLIDAYAQDEEFERSPRQRVRSDVENLGPVSSKTPQTSSFNSPPTLHNRKAQELKPLHPDHWLRYLHGSEQTLTLLWFGVWLSLHIPVTLQALRSRNSVFCVFTQAFFPSHTKSKENIYCTGSLRWTCWVTWHGGEIILDLASEQ